MGTWHGDPDDAAARHLAEHGMIARLGPPDGDWRVGDRVRVAGHLEQAGFGEVAGIYSRPDASLELAVYFATGATADYPASDLVWLRRGWST